MLRRNRAALIIPATVLLLGGCGLATPIATQTTYNASDGVRVDVSDDVRVNNLMVLTQDESAPGLLIGQLVNDSRTDDVDLVLSDADGAELYAAPVDAHGTDNLADDPVEVDLADAVPGSTVTVNVGVEGGETVTAQVPVLDGTLEEYAQYLEEHEPAGDAPTDDATGN